MREERAWEIGGEAEVEADARDEVEREGASMRRRSRRSAASARVESMACASSRCSAASLWVGETATGCGESSKAEP